MSVKIGNDAPEFCIPDSDGQEVCLKNYLGKWVVLYFYPKDNTSGCTLEAVNFTRQMAGFMDQGAVILGVSPDSQKSHCGFRDKHDLKITLLSDPEHRVLDTYGVWVLKKMYGREYYGVERSTFLIDPEGHIAHEWRKVKVEGHVEAVREMLSELQGG